MTPSAEKRSKRERERDSLRDNIAISTIHLGVVSRSGRNGIIVIGAFYLGFTRLTVILAL